MNVAVLGAGPAGIFSSDGIVRSLKDTRVDIFEQLPVPFGLVRYGIAPDHVDAKSQQGKLQKILEDSRINFYGNVEVGTDIKVKDIRENYNGILVCTGTQSDHELGVPGENSGFIYPARDFVAWYNGHPFASDVGESLAFEKCHSVVVVGIGNVALDVARAFLQDETVLSATDMPSDVVRKLKLARVSHMYIVGRRGPMQMACSPKELRELCSIPGLRIVTNQDQKALLGQDPECTKILDAMDPSMRRKQLRLAKILHDSVERSHVGHWGTTVHFDFCQSPQGFFVDKTGRGVVSMGKNRLDLSNGKVSAVDTSERFSVNADLVLRSIGYRSSPVPGIPFDAKTGTIPNRQGQVFSSSSPTASPIKGVYTAGWIKRGPKGCVGDNIECAQESVLTLLKTIDKRPTPGFKGVEELLRSHGSRIVTWDMYKNLDTLEVSRGRLVGKPREKFTQIEEMRIPTGGYIISP